MHACKQCGGSIGPAFRYCPWCAAPQRAKLVEFFTGTGGEGGKALRVSRYTSEGHVRFSVWSAEGVAEAAVSIDDEGAAAPFLGVRERLGSCSSGCALSWRSASATAAPRPAGGR
jgi:hypothetical protein